MHRGNPARLSLAAGLALLVCLPGSVRGAVREAFETPETSWRLADRDCRVEFLTHRRTFQEAHGGYGSEHVRLTAGQGTYIHLVHDVDASRVIEELVARTWV